MYMCMCHQVSLISFLKSQFTLITNISPKQKTLIYCIYSFGGPVFADYNTPEDHDGLWSSCCGKSQKKHFHVVNHGINLKRMRNVVDCWRPSTSHAESWNSLEAHPTAFMEMWSIMTIFCGESSNVSFEITKLKWKLRAKCNLWWIRPKTSLFMSKSSWSSRWMNSPLGQWHVSNPKVAADCVKYGPD